MQKWEYFALPMLASAKETRLNELGAKGWELVAAVRDGMIITLYFKRPLPSNPN